MFDASQVARFRLARGVHDWPNPKGHLCLNEAATLAAGYKYRPISSPDDFPPCFSSVIGAYGIWLNEFMPDCLRHDLLLPFVVRMAGTRDAAAAEKRKDFIVFETVKRIGSMVLKEKFGNRGLSMVSSRSGIHRVFDRVYMPTMKAGEWEVASMTGFLAFAVDTDDTWKALKACVMAAEQAAKASPRKKRRVWGLTTEILDGAIKLGLNQDQPVRELLPA